MAIKTVEANSACGNYYMVFTDNSMLDFRTLDVFQWKPTVYTPSNPVRLRPEIVTYPTTHLVRVIRREFLRTDKVQRKWDKEKIRWWGMNLVLRDLKLIGD